MEECTVEYLYLLVSKARIEMCRDTVHIELMPIDDVAERHVYPFYGKIDEVVKELEKLIIDIDIIKSRIRR